MTQRLQEARARSRVTARANLRAFLVGPFVDGADGVGAAMATRRRWGRWRPAARPWCRAGFPGTRHTHRDGTPDRRLRAGTVASNPPVGEAARTGPCGTRRTPVRREPRPRTRAGPPRRWCASAPLPSLSGRAAHDTSGRARSERRRRSPGAVDRPRPSACGRTTRQPARPRPRRSRVCHIVPIDSPCPSSARWAHHSGMLRSAPYAPAANNPAPPSAATRRAPTICASRAREISRAASAARNNPPPSARQLTVNPTAVINTFIAHPFSARATRSITPLPRQRSGAVWRT